MRKLVKEESFIIKSFCNPNRNMLFIVKIKTTIVKLCLQEFQIQ